MSTGMYMHPQGRNELYFMYICFWAGVVELQRVTEQGRRNCHGSLTCGKVQVCIGSTMQKSTTCLGSEREDRVSE